MAFDLRTDALRPTVYDRRIDLADLTASSAVQDLGRGYSKFRLTTFVKTASTAFTFRLDIADNSGFTANVRTVCRYSHNNAVGCLTQEGIAPIGPQRFARVVVEAGTGTFDARIEAGR